MKTVEEFVKAMETTEMQEAFEKFAEGKTVATAEDADKLVKEFAAENGFDISEGTVEFVESDEELSEEELANIAGGRGFRGEKMTLASSLIRDDNGLYKGLTRDKNGIRLRMSFIAQDKKDDEDMRNTLVII